MNEDQQSFESLRRLLALKRHEVPPPGYFNHFSRQVIARIRVGGAAEPAGLLGMPWLFKWLQNFETRPVFAGSFATGICVLLLLFGVVMAQRPESTTQAFLQQTPSEANSSPLVAVAAPMTSAALEQPAGQIMIGNSSTNPVINFGPAPEARFTSLPAAQTPGPQFLTFPVSGN